MNRATSCSIGAARTAVFAAALAACSGEPSRSVREDLAPAPAGAREERSAIRKDSSGRIRTARPRPEASSPAGERAREAAAGVAGAPAPKAPPSKTASTRTTSRRRPRTEPKVEAAPAIADALLADLNASDTRRVQAAFWRIAEIPKKYIPDLISAVERQEPTKLTRVKILVLDGGFFAEGQLVLANRIHGLGRMEEIEGQGDDIRIRSKEYTDLSCGITGNKRYVVIDRIDGFPLGLVIRAGLINRFRTSRHPDGGDDDPASGRLIAWWRAFYEMEKGNL